MTPTEEIQALVKATGIPVAFLASLIDPEAQGLRQRLHNLINPEHRARATAEELYQVKEALRVLVDDINRALTPYQHQESDGRIVVKAQTEAYTILQ